MKIGFNIAFLFVLMIMMVGCASKHAIRPGDTADMAFEKAMGLYEKENYSRAAEAFETVLSIARGTELAADAQYFLAQSHYENRSYLLAANEYSRFARNYTKDERRQEAEFKEAYSYYKMSPRYNLDQTETYNALDRFQLFVSRYPGTELAERAVEYMDELRDKLAKKSFEAGEMYMRIGNYRSAALYYSLTVQDFPESSWTEPALVNKVLAYVNYAENSVRQKQKERFEKAVESYEQYIQTFPNGKKRSLAEEYYDRALTGLSEVSTLTAER